MSTQLIKARWVIPMEGPQPVLHDYAVVLESGRIKEVLPCDSALAEYSGAEVLDYPNHVLLPGLVNAHGHAAMTLMRGFADDLPLHSWMQDRIWPTEARWVDEDFVRTGTRLAVAEMLRTGTTCFADMYYYPDQAAEVAREMGMRAQIAAPLINVPNQWSRSFTEGLSLTVALHDRWRDDEYINIAMGPHAVYTLEPKELERVGMYASEVGANIHIHVAETQTEVQDCMDAHGVSPLRLLHDLGLGGRQLQAVHLVHLSDADRELMAGQNTYAIHCPASNLKLGSGICDLDALRECGVTVALGTDGAASNNQLDLFMEMRLAALLIKGTSGDAAALPAYDALRMATLDGATVLGMEQEIGSLVAGKCADLIAVDLSAPGSIPVHDPLAQLVYACSGQQVDSVWVNGQLRLRGGELCGVDLEKIRASADLWGKRISS